MKHSFENNIIDMYGSLGRDWLNALDSNIALIASKFELHGLKPVPNMSFNYVATGFQQERPIVLKFGLNAKALQKEAVCLNAFNGYGVPVVYACEENLLIMEQAIPGTPLKSYFPIQEHESITIASEVLKNLHEASVPDNHGFYHVSELLIALDSISSIIPNKILNKARLLRDKLLATATHEVLLHGDLHHDNILKSGEGWLAIDPKGFIGDPAFDCSAFISNPIPELLHQQAPNEIIQNRIQKFSKQLDIPFQRIKDWHYVKTVLCWVWCIEDNLNANHFEQIVKLID